MRHSLARALLAVLALAPLLGCSAIRTFQGLARPEGGHDGAGGGDQIYFQLRNVEGLDGPVAALVLPEDWPTRDAVISADGTARLTPPIEPAWLFGRSIEPRVEIRSTAPGSGNVEIRSLDSIPLRVDVLEERSALARDRESIVTRLGVGASAYALIDLSSVSGDADRVTRYALFGARLTPEGELQWVELCELELRDGRGAVSRGLDVVLRRSRAVEIAFFAAAITLPIWIWFVV
ncbi:MAG: hypothetical protein AAGI22_21525 [Planctomycetota bacterium]